MESAFYEVKINQSNSINAKQQCFLRNVYMAEKNMHQDSRKNRESGRFPHLK